MKKMIIIPVMAALVLTINVIPCKAQGIAGAIQQLAIDYQKLAGLKSVLKQMYQGYEVVNKGYGSVKDISKGNFTLHEAFLDGLMVVSPSVRKYPRVQDIIDDQLSVLSEYKSAYNTFRQDKHFTPDELGYMLDTYNNLVGRSTANLSELTMVMTDNKLRMSDEERLSAIDRIYTTGHEQIGFLRSFNDKARALAIARSRQSDDKATLKKLYGIQ